MQGSNKKIQLTDLQRLGFLLKKYVRPYWKSMALFFLITLLATFFAAILPLIMAPILDAVLGKTALVAGDGADKVTLGNLSLKNIGAVMLNMLNLEATTDRFRLILIFSGLYVGIGLMKSLANFASYLMALWIRVRSARDMQHDLYKHILNLSLSFFYRQKTGELLSRIENDTSATTSGFQATFTSLIMSPILILFYGVLLIRTSPKLAIAAVVGGVLHYGLTKGIQKPIRRHVADQFSAFAELGARLQESILSIRIVKSFSAEDHEINKLKDAIRAIIRINMKYGVFKHVEKPTRETFNRLVEVGILLFAAYELILGRLDTSTFFMFLYVGRSIMAPISEIGTTFTSIQNTLAASDRVFELFSERSKVVDGPKKIVEFHKSIKIQDVAFAYEKRRVLENINLEITKGETIALVGPSGAGKSTLSDLILRFYDPLEGSITIDGNDLRDFKQKSYRRLFGVVPQEALLFNATIRENILYGCEGLTEADIIQAANIANAHDFITELPNGYDTLVGDRGIRLSGGQRQRVAIARAIVSKPQILIMDEATSSLDSESEKLVQEAIERIIENSTAIVIAHRLSTVLHADKIVVIDNGRIIDHGRHAELQERCKLYNRICQLQFDIKGNDIMGCDDSQEQSQENDDQLKNLFVEE